MIIILSLSCCLCLPDVKILDVNILVGSGLSLAPQQEALFGRCFCGSRKGIIVKSKKLVGIFFD